MHDHRRLGRELDLFDTDPLMGAGLPYWLPDGAIVRHTLEEYIRDAELRAGYRHVYSPVLGKRELYEISGHFDHYGDDMFPPMDVGAEQILLRPSLCPHHALIYRSRSHSYRELPLRMAELGGMYRTPSSSPPRNDHPPGPESSPRPFVSPYGAGHQPAVQGRSSSGSSTAQTCWIRAAAVLTPRGARGPPGRP
jgi:hypothetical protein